MSTTSGTWPVSVTIRPAPALGQHIVDHLRRLIITGELASGMHLVEAQLSETFDVSRGPVRDALRQLETEGLVESRRRGVFVIGLSEDDIEELYSVRQLLEAEAVRLCMAAAPTDYAEAREAVERMGAAAERSDTAAFAEADLDFHASFYAMSGHRRLGSIWQQYRPTFADMLAVTNTMDQDLVPTHRDHVRLLDVVVAKDADRALPLLREHIDGSRRRMLSAYGRFISTT